VGYPAFKGEASGVKGLTLPRSFHLGYGLYLANMPVFAIYMFIYLSFSHPPVLKSKFSVIKVAHLKF
jgi:hypothetical protein